MAREDLFPPLRLREVVGILLVVAAAVAAIAVEVTTSHPAKHPTGSVAKRIASGRGSYDVVFPPHTTLSEARAIALQPFPKDARVIFYSEKAYCATEVVTSRELERRVPPGVFGIEFLSRANRSQTLPLLNEHEVRSALVVVLDSTQSQPSC